eukprot:270535-Prorocentrum_lima.AAC.1
MPWAVFGCAHANTAWEGHVLSSAWRARRNTLFFRWLQTDPVKSLAEAYVAGEELEGLPEFA